MDWRKLGQLKEKKEKVTQSHLQRPYWETCSMVSLKIYIRQMQLHICNRIRRIAMITLVMENLILET